MTEPHPGEAGTMMKSATASATQPPRTAVTWTPGPAPTTTAWNRPAGSLSRDREPVTVADW
jgi:hypothetical protein